MANESVFRTGIVFFPSSSINSTGSVIYLTSSFDIRGTITPISNNSSDNFSIPIPTLTQSAAIFVDSFGDRPMASQIIAPRGGTGGVSQPAFYSFQPFIAEKQIYTWQAAGNFYSKYGC